MYGSPFICLRRLRYLKLKNNELTTMAEETFQGLVSLTALKLTKNRITFHYSTPVFAPLISLDILHLGENRINVIFPEIFVNLSVTKLTLALNYISGWSVPIFSRMIYLNDLRLDGNKIHVLNNFMYNDMANMSNVRICYNPWDCTNCDIKNVRHFLLEAGRNHCCVECAVCSAHQKTLSNVLVVDAAPATEQACRPPDYYVIIGAPIITVFLFGSMTSYVVYTKRWYIRYFFLSLRIKVKSYRRLHTAEPFLWDSLAGFQAGRLCPRDLRLQRSSRRLVRPPRSPDAVHCAVSPEGRQKLGAFFLFILITTTTTFLWDAFVSYHNSDAEWVHEHIVPTLESTVHRFRLCVAERDFIPGLPITENVCRGISQSRKSLFVLSRQFCESRWCMFELTLAQHRLFESERESEMVFIRRQPLDDSSLCPVLSYLLKTKTYIQAPPEDAEGSARDYFWLQLRAALEF
ncbi:hypothetical protein HPB51_014748 [Rhipicephalus microplus]|uniref:TIR domain-containing protein n=1 Tax=Rhipicephalus microplus TaxID=6941 RepID=A0A9J6DND3_RHIMP|nr:hypothetical protein HPB51_014748 [Rhipicephalus microplus]